jgi:hypothetical protein
MEFEDTNDTIYNIFKHEYIFSYPSRDDWHVFINNKNIGILHNRKYSRHHGWIIYTIVDEKKWMLTKIKYGI